MKFFVLVISFIFSATIIAFDIKKISAERRSEIYHEINGLYCDTFGYDYQEREQKAREVIRNFDPNSGNDWTAYSLGSCSKPSMEVAMACSSMMGPTAPLGFEKREYIWAKMLLQRPRELRASEAYKRSEGCSIL